MADRLAGRTVLVVGAGTRPSPEPDAPLGNGRAISVACAREGATVVCADLDGEAAEATAALVREAGGEAVVVEADVTDEDDVARMVAAAPGLTGVVVNAGIGRGGGLRRTSADDWDATLAVNLRGPFLVARAAVAAMVEAEQPGSLVLIGSLAGLQPGSRLPAYDASKAGLIGLCRHVALEGARRGIRANVVAPGLIDTPLGRAATAGRPSRGETPVPLGRQGDATEVAAAVVFLLSDEASYITGTTLPVDGGLALI
ncbi:SDR family NAD(P)-dependent oxidoreductase [Iamia majanohamensis]|uniref:SDR family NAD(P)-dependent oxidoreductase n=1 Tax=Iamia majanohamensis TaxID=467976 RepID=A0AAF0BWL1_9ACTN|nr:SDR family NAD(P)-dependent oxidoreductase [Iamia majanohamensis]WCO67569.1 SDR family NAD(P)-dependent oxidoreductase [Iamia majanohamensis]